MVAWGVCNVLPRRAGWYSVLHGDSLFFQPLVVALPHRDGEASAHGGHWIVHRARCARGAPSGVRGGLIFVGAAVNNWMSNARRRILKVRVSTALFVSDSPFFVAEAPLHSPHAQGRACVPPMTVLMLLDVFRPLVPPRGVRLRGGIINCC